MTAEDATEELHLLRAAEHAAVEPWALLQAVRDQTGGIVDFVYHDINCVAARQQRLQREDLLGRSVAETLPEVARIGLIKQYAHCVETGEPLILDDLPYYGRTLDSPGLHTHRYELRGVRVESDYLSLNWRDTNQRHLTHQNEVLAQELLRAGADSLLDPQVLLEAVRDSSGTIVDFAYREVNQATCDYLGMAREELLGRGVVETTPGTKATLLPGYIRCLHTGAPMVLNDFSYDNEILLDTRRYDIRVTRATPNCVTLTWRDVTDRFEETQRLADSEEQYRLLAENSTDIVCHVRDGEFVWVSPSIEAVLGAPAEYWLGQQIYAHIPPEDLAEQAALMATVVGGGEIKHRGRVVGVDGVVHWFDLRARPFFAAGGIPDGVVATLRLADDEVAAEWQAREDRRRLEDARVRQAESKALERGVIDKSIVATAMSDVEGRFELINQAMCDLVGYDADALRQMTWQELTPPEFLDDGLQGLTDLLSGKLDIYRAQKQFLHHDGRRVWGDIAVSLIRTPAGEPHSLIAQILDITSDMESRQRLEEARQQQARADALFRRSMDSAAVGMCLADLEGNFIEVNAALCEFFGYDAQTLRQMTWQELTAADYLEADLVNRAEVLAGRSESYRMVKQFIHADGHPIWGDLAVSCIRGDDGQVEIFIGQIADITAEVQARSRLVASEERNRILAESLQDEISSAARYVQSVLPGDLAGRVSVSSRYLPAQTLGGDCFDFFWIDDDHLITYLLDVSGHGVESALVAVSVHNLLRSVSLPTETLLEPDQVLATLNNQFAMEQHDLNYFTVFYGVYQPSTATLRYSSGGHPPALLFTGGQITALPNHAAPVGIFEDTAFANTTVPIPPGSQILLYSDGAFELPLDDGGQWSHDDFLDSCARLAGSPDWSLDDLIETLRRRSATGSFNDDCCLVRLDVD